MSELKQLYQEVILEHSKSPRNFKKLEGADRSAEGFNPLCGDRITIYVKLDGGVIRNVSFEGSGCAISKASASILTTCLKGKSEKEMADLFEKFHALVTGDPDAMAQAEALGKLAVFSGVSEFPVRVKCATLAWHTLKAALNGSANKVSTE